MGMEMNKLRGEKMEMEQAILNLTEETSSIKNISSKWINIIRYSNNNLQSIREDLIVIQEFEVGNNPLQEGQEISQLRAILSS